MCHVLPHNLKLHYELIINHRLHPISKQKSSVLSRVILSKMNSEAMIETSTKSISIWFVTWITFFVTMHESYYGEHLLQIQYKMNQPSPISKISQILVTMFSAFAFLFDGKDREHPQYRLCGIAMVIAHSSIDLMYYKHGKTKLSKPIAHLITIITFGSFLFGNTFYIQSQITFLYGIGNILFSLATTNDWIKETSSIRSVFMMINVLTRYIICALMYQFVADILFNKVNAFNTMEYCGHLLWMLINTVVIPLDFFSAWNAIR